MLFFALHASEETEPVRIRRLIRLLSVGWLPPSVPPSGACLSLGTSILDKPLNAIAGSPTPGLRLCQCTKETFGVTGAMVLALLDLRCYRELLGHRPPASHPLTGHGHRDHIGMFASCEESSGSCTQPDLGLPTAVLDHVRLLLKAPLAMAPDLGG